jgi:hypothetical protein
METVKHGHLIVRMDSIAQARIERHKAMHQIAGAPPPTRSDGSQPNEPGVERLAGASHGITNRGS